MTAAVAATLSDDRIITLRWRKHDVFIANEASNGLCVYGFAR